MNKYFYLYIFIIFFTSCQESNEEINFLVIEEDIPPTELNGERVFEKEYAITYLNKIDSLFIINTQHEPLIKVYNEERILLSQFGSYGQGPNEYMNLPLVRDGHFDSKSIKFLVYDDPQRRLSYLDLFNSEDSLQVVINKEIILPPELSGTMELFHIDDDNLFGVYSDNFYQLLDSKRGSFIFSIKSLEYKLYPLINLYMDPYDLNAAANINTRMSAISPDREKVVSALVYYPLIEIISTTTNKRMQFLLEEYPPSQTFDLESFSEGNINTYTQFIYSTHEYIYILYIGSKIIPDTDFNSFIKVND